MGRKAKFTVCLTQTERGILKKVIEKQEDTSEKIRRANILLKLDTNGENWSDAQIAEKYSCDITTVKVARRRFAVEGFNLALNGKHQEGAASKKTVDEQQEAALISMRLGLPPQGANKWSWRLLATEMMSQGIVDHISHELVRRIAKKRFKSFMKHGTFGLKDTPIALDKKNTKPSKALDALAAPLFYGSGRKVQASSSMSYHSPAQDSIIYANCVAAVEKSYHKMGFTIDENDTKQCKVLSECAYKIYNITTTNKQDTPDQFLVEIVVENAFSKK